MIKKILTICLSYLFYAIAIYSSPSALPKEAQRQSGCFEIIIGKVLSSKNRIPFDIQLFKHLYWVLTNFKEREEFFGIPPYNRKAQIEVEHIIIDADKDISRRINKQKQLSIAMRKGEKNCRYEKSIRKIIFPAGDWGKYLVDICDYDCIIGINEQVECIGYNGYEKSPSIKEIFPLDAFIERVRQRENKENKGRLPI